MILKKSKPKWQYSAISFICGICVSAAFIFMLVLHISMWFSFRGDESFLTHDTYLQKTAFHSNRPVSSQNVKGWKSINIFYGEEAGLEIPVNQKWFGQVNQDEIVFSLIGPNGYFIDLAANDAVEFSNTLALEKN